MQMFTNEESQKNGKSVAFLVKDRYSSLETEKQGDKTLALITKNSPKCSKK